MRVGLRRHAARASLAVAGVHPFPGGGVNPAAIHEFGAGTLIAFAVLLMCSFFFSGSETALFSLQKFDRQRLGAKVGGPRVLKLLERRSALITTIIIGNETVNVTTSA